MNKLDSCGSNPKVLKRDFKAVHLTRLKESRGTGNEIRSPTTLLFYLQTFLCQSNAAQPGDSCVPPSWQCSSRGYLHALPTPFITVQVTGFQARGCLGRLFYLCSVWCLCMSYPLQPQLRVPARIACSTTSVPVVFQHPEGGWRV